MERDGYESEIAKLDEIIFDVTRVMKTRDLYEEHTLKINP